MWSRVVARWRIRLRPTGAILCSSSWRNEILNLFAMIGCTFEACQTLMFGTSRKTGQWGRYLFRESMKLVTEGKYLKYCWYILPSRSWGDFVILPPHVHWKRDLFFLFLSEKKCTTLCSPRGYSPRWGCAARFSKPWPYFRPKYFINRVI